MNTVALVDLCLRADNGDDLAQVLETAQAITS
jgi:hypothetical protein